MVMKPIGCACSGRPDGLRRFNFPLDEDELDEPLDIEDEDDEDWDDEDALGKSAQ